MKQMIINTNYRESWQTLAKLFTIDSNKLYDLVYQLKLDFLTHCGCDDIDLEWLSGTEPVRPWRLHIKNSKETKWIFDGETIEDAVQVARDFVDAHINQARQLAHIQSRRPSAHVYDVNDPLCREWLTDQVPAAHIDYYMDQLAKIHADYNRLTRTTVSLGWDPTRERPWAIWVSLARSTTQWVYDADTIEGALSRVRDEGLRLLHQEFKSPPAKPKPDQPSTVELAARLINEICKTSGVKFEIYEDQIYLVAIDEHGRHKGEPVPL